MKVFSKGSTVGLNGQEYTIEKMIAVDDNKAVYTITGDGPDRILCCEHDQAEVYLQNDDDFIEVEPLYHYQLDWRAGKVVSKQAYCIAQRADDKFKRTRYLVFSPEYIGILQESNLGIVSRDYQMLTLDENFELAEDDIRNAVIERGLQLSRKVEEYGELLDRLDGVEPEDTES